MKRCGADLKMVPIDSIYYPKRRSQYTRFLKNGVWLKILWDDMKYYTQQLLLKNLLIGCLGIFNEIQESSVLLISCAKNRMKQN